MKHHPRIAFTGAVLLLAHASARADLVITEIHYAPIDASGAARSDLEFIEIANDGPEPYDLYGFSFTGITFEFAERLFLPGRGYLVVCRDAAALTAHYGIQNVIGNFGGSLDNAGEEIALLNPQGSVVSRVDYNDRGRWPSGAKGTGHSLSIIAPYRDPSDPESWRLSGERGGTPGAANFAIGPTFIDTVLVASGTSWRYLKGTQAPSSPVTAWRSTTFNDATWLSGLTGIGYGDGDDRTQLGDMENNYLTVFCRKFFTVPDVSAVEDLVLGIRYDDGFTAYLNGSEVASRNVSGDAFDDEASSAIEPTSEDIDISAFKNLLVNGTNLIAVQVHNAGIGSSDLSFDPRLVSRRTIPPSSSGHVPIVINEGFFRTASAASRFIELHNMGTDDVELGGYYLTDQFSTLEKFRIPDGASIPGGGFVRFTQPELGFDLSIVPLTKERVSVALVDPEGAHVVDAFIFEPAIDGKSEARYPDGAARFSPAVTPTPSAPNEALSGAEIVINEIFYHPPSGDAADEFVELYNAGATAVDLSGWSLRGVDIVLPNPTMLAAGDYLVLARDPARIRSRYGLSAEAVVDTPWLGVLRDGGERIELEDLYGNTIDSVDYRDGGEWPAWADGGGSSLELVDPRSDNDVAGSWDASDDSADAETRTITYSNVPYGGGEPDFGMMLAEKGIVLIDDISLVKTGTATNLIPNGTFDTNETGWRFEGTHVRSGRTASAAERIAGAGSLKLIAWNGGGDYKVNRIETEAGPQGTGTYTVSYKARWVVGSPRIITIGDYNVTQPGNPGLAGSNAAPLPPRLGTPGARNSVTERQIARTGSENIGPSIDLVSHSPAVPQANEQVTVSARVRDPDGVDSVTLRFRTDTPVGAFTQVVMADPDGDGVWTGNIPGLALGTKVLFFVVAEDVSGAVSRFPADILERTHPPVVDSAAAAANDELFCMYRHDTRPVTSQHSYRFILNDPNLEYLRTRKVHSNDVIEGTFVFDSEDVYYNAKIRFAGSPWLRSSGSFSNSYAIRMPKDNPLHGRKEAFNLDTHGSDGRERISHYLLRQSAGAGTLPYFDGHALVRFQLNDVRDATYEALDKPNRQYLDYWFPDAEWGNFFEMDDRFSFNDNGDRTGNADGKLLYPPYGAISDGTNKENFRWFFSPRQNESKDDFSQLQFLAYIMDSRVTSHANFDAGISNILDVEELLRTFAIELNIDDWDTWGGRRGKNCYFYQSPVDVLWRKVPWDLELTYGDVNAFPMPGSITGTYSSAFSEVTRLMNRPRIKRLYYGILAEQVDLQSGFFHSAFLGPYMQEIAAAGVGNTGVGMPGGWIDQRAAKIRDWVRSAVFPQVRLEITTSGGEPFATSGVMIDLEGKAPADVFFLIVSRGGIVLEPTPLTEFSTTDVLGWKVTGIPIPPGTNEIEVLGLSSRGDIVDRDLIEVTSTSDWAPPGIVDVDPDTVLPGDPFVIQGEELHDGVRVFFDGGIEAAGVTYRSATDPERITARVPAELLPGLTTLVIRNADGQESEPWPFTVAEPGSLFVRGDANLDYRIDISDGLKVLLHLFAGEPVTCLDALDTNDSGSLEITDAILLLDHLFRGGATPSEPHPFAGEDPTSGDALDCSYGLS